MLTLPEFARAFRVAYRTALMWLESGRIAGAVRTPGGHWRIPRRTFEGLWLAGYCPADPDAQAELVDELTRRAAA